MENCLFCKIAAGEIPSRKAYEDELVLAFHDIAPQAPVHVLIIPQRHIKDAYHLEKGDASLLFHMFEVANKLAAELGIAEKGFRIVTNVGEDGGQSVPHLHLHLLGGRSLQWPPG
jgi:histidine triad (HIT) family protein